jgi:hypothetical protein
MLKPTISMFPSIPVVFLAGWCRVVYGCGCDIAMEPMDGRLIGVEPCTEHYEALLRID